MEDDICSFCPPMLIGVVVLQCLRLQQVAQVNVEL